MPQLEARVSTVDEPLADAFTQAIRPYTDDDGVVFALATCVAEAR